MTKRKTGASDPVEQAIEKALQPGRFVSYGASHEFVSELERVASEIEKVVPDDGARAARLYEIFIAGCYEKAGELDDSGGNLGMFVEDLFCGWVRARVRERANPDETAKTLLEWMDKDEYGFCHGLEREVVKAFDKEGLAAFAREVREALVKGDDDTFGRQRRGEILRAIYLQQQDLDAYVSFCEKSGLSAKDCLAIAEMLKARRKFDEALAWVQRGLTLNRKGPDYSGGEFDLDRMKRNLLSKLGRAGEAVDEAWSEFQKHPSIFRYEELMRFVPKAERATWHERAMNAANGGDLGSLIELWLKTKEIDRLVCRLRKTADAEIEDLSHYTTEPAAKRLAKAHPDVAARIYRALGMRILNAKKSKYYDAALSNFQDAKRCYERAGLAGDWQAVVAEVRQAHYRKVGFMDGFEKLVAGHGPSDEPSFLERARTRWLRRERS